MIVLLALLFRAFLRGQLVDEARRRLALAAVLVWRFLRTGGLPMLRTMNRPATEHGYAHA